MEIEEVSESGKLTSDLPLEASIPTGAAPLESILCTEELGLRPSRPPQYEEENRALVALVCALADSPRTILQTLADKVLAILHADSAGLSLLTKDGKRFYWAAIAGAWRPHLGGGTPRNFGPCGDVLDRSIPMLFTHWERRYPYLSVAMPLADEGLLVPFYVNGKAVGTIWVIAHSNSRKFDAEDLRLLESMGRFASAAYQAVESIENLKLENAAREKAQIELRELTDGLEAQVHVRTEELRRNEEFLAEAQRLSSTGSFLWRVKTDEVMWSAEAHRIFELDSAVPMTPALIRTRVHPEDLPSFDETVERARVHGGDFEYEHRLQMPDYSVKHVHVVAHATRNQDGDLQYIGAIQDVTQLRLAQRLEAMGTLAGGIAHDFNNILGAILGFSEMASRDLPKGSRLQRDLESIVTAGERGRALVDRILAFSRSAVGERVPVHVEKVVREALDLVAAKLPPGVTLTAQLRAGRAATLGDPTQVHQVMMNLGTNAVQTMPSGGILRVSLDAVRCEAARAATIGKVAAGDYVVLRVADSGSGIAPEILERIFDPFFTTKELGTGTGLGLSLVHGIVADLGGAIDLESTPGKGSAFTVHLPRTGDAADADESEEAALPRGEGQRVIVVDDEEPLVQLATRTLEDLGYRPVGFTSSAAALAAFCAEPGRFDALIADERMPGLSGTALIREVRGVRRAIPILLMSGYVGGAVASLAREAGADDVLKKPLLARDLATSLARVLQQ